MNSIIKENTKESITKLADEAKLNINRNKYLLEIIEIYKQQISIVKNLITNYSLNINKSNKSKYNLSFEYKNQLSLLNSKLKDEINKIFKKKDNNINYISQDLSIINQTLTEFSVDNFILKNTIKKYNNIIKKLNESIELSKKYDIFREPKRESEIDIKESKNVFLVYNLECQTKMLSYCRDYSKYKYKNVKKKSKINSYKNNISILKKIIKYYSSKIYGDEIKILNNIKENEKKEKINNKNIVDVKKRVGTTPINKEKYGKIINNLENKKNINELNNYKNNINDNSFNKTSFLFEDDKNILKNINKEDINENEENKSTRKKINILKIDELLDIENIEIKDENIIEDELNSDDEIYFEKKIKPKKKIITDFLPNIKNRIPSLSLTQIEFNKLKVINEADAYSLQKRKFELGNINGKIKNIKKQIKNLQKKITINKNKLNVIHEFIEDVKYNYKLLRPIKVQTSAAGNQAIYIREKLLNIVEESIAQTEKKENKILSDNKFKTGKTAVEEGEDNDEELIGSDYSDEDEYLENSENKDFEYYNKKNILFNNNKDKVINFDNNKKYKNKQKNRKIKTNLISKFESGEKEENNIFGNNICNDIKNDIFECINAKSK